MTVATGPRDSGQEVIVQGEGMPIRGTNRHGDLIVNVNVQFPHRLSKAQRECTHLCVSGGTWRPIVEPARIRLSWCSAIGPEECRVV